MAAASPAAEQVLDPVTTGIYWNKLIAIADEATATLLRTAFSRIVTDAWDFTCALFDANGEMVAQARHGLPAFIGSLAMAVRHAIRAFPPDRLQPGDTLLLNDPWLNTGQLNDYACITPIFHRGCLVAYAANVSHSPDVGGRLLSGDSREIFEEGFRIPITKVFRRGRPNDYFFDFIRLNVRVPDIVIGDLMAQFAANQVMSRRLVEFLRQLKLPTSDVSAFQLLANEILARSEAEMRRACAALPPGTYSGEVTVDGFDAPLSLRLTLDVRTDGIRADYAGTAPQQEFGINCVWNYTFAETVFALICVARPAAPPNGGMLRVLEVVAPLGSVVNAQPPAALGARGLVSMALQALVFRTLAPIVPDRVVADAGTPPVMPAFAGVGRTGRRFVDILFLNGGFGARPNRDGLAPIGWPANLSTTPVEVSENEKPIHVLRRELVTDSGGPGRYRGGPSQEFVWRSEASEPITFGTRLDRVEHPPLGLFGGGPALGARATLNGEALHSKKTVLVRPGDVVALRSAGGGGYGDPSERDPDAVRADVANGYVSPNAARSIYGVEQ